LQYRRWQNCPYVFRPILSAKSTTARLFDAEGCYGRALALAEPPGIRPLLAHCHLGLGKMHHRMDDPGQAREHLTTATQMYREMGMIY
jgi:hypothetical protein